MRTSDHSWFPFAVVAVMALAALACVGLGHKESYSPELAGQTKYVTYSQVNVREEPNVDADIVTTLTQGQQVKLSGNTIEYRFSDENGYWYQTEEGYWVTGDALLSQYDFEKRFGE